MNPNSLVALPTSSHSYATQDFSTLLEEKFIPKKQYFLKITPPIPKGEILIKRVAEYDENPKIKRIRSESMSYNTPQYFLNDKKSSDVILKIDGKKVYAHQNYLTSYSLYFQEVFDKFKGMPRKNGKLEIELANFSFEIYEKYLNFIYTQKVRFTIDDIFSFSQAANVFSDQTLIRLCKEYVSDSINFENAMNFLDNVDKTSPVYDNVLYFISKYAEDIIDPFSISEEQLIKILEYPFDFNIEVFNLIVEWLERQNELSETSLQKIKNLLIIQMETLSHEDIWIDVDPVEFQGNRLFTTEELVTLSRKIAKTYY